MATLREARETIREAIALYLESATEGGLIEEVAV
jgi:hypothetical protein